MRLPGALAGVVIASVAFTAVPAAAQEMPSLPGPIKVPCSADALIAAITTANSRGTAVVSLSTGCTYDITVPAAPTDGLPIITGRVNLIGIKAVIRRSDTAATDFRILDVASSGMLTVNGVSIMYGVTSGLGGGIENAGTVVLNQAKVSADTAANGGGLANLAGATASLRNSQLDSDTATSVGGGGIINFGTLTLAGSVLIGNTAQINGGGLNTQPSGVSRLIQSTVTRNTSAGLGGGMSNLGTTSLVSSWVQHNTGTAGGGIATGNDRVTLTNSSVANNAPDNCSPRNTIPGCAD